MKIGKTNIEDLLIIKPDVYEDDRGYFVETYNQLILKEFGFEEVFVQDNESKSQKGVLRGLHFQISPFAQGKLVRVIKGAVLDVAVDIRKKSPTYGQYVAVELSEKNKWQFWLPPGFAHGFLTLEDNTVFAYKCTKVYNKKSERSIRWNDPDLNIDWKIENPILSERDKQTPFFKDLKDWF